MEINSKNDSMIILFDESSEFWFNSLNRKALKSIIENCRQLSWDIFQLYDFILWERKQLHTEKQDMSSIWNTV